MEIEVSEIGNRFVGTAGGNLTRPHETSEASSDLDVEEVRRVQFVLLAKEAGLNSCAKRGLGPCSHGATQPLPRRDTASIPARSVEPFSQRTRSFESVVRQGLSRWPNASRRTVCGRQSENPGAVIAEADESRVQASLCCGTSTSHRPLQTVNRGIH